jgi:uncharacterized DUF497 family protein/uncharacterized protein (DUF4415 family)
MRYTWDERKNRSNIRRHGIAFEDAKRIFDGPTVENVDYRFDYGEVRVYAVGLVNGLEITVIYTDEDNGKDASSQRGELSRTKGATSGKVSNARRGTDWKRLRRLTAADIRAGIEADPDAHGTNEEFWKNATVVLPRREAAITIRLDADLLDWLRRQKSYQTRINAILRAYMKAHPKG